MWLVPRFPCALPFPPCRPRAEVPVRPLALFLEARAGVALTQDLEGRPILGELFRRWVGMTDFGRCWDCWS
jgi:hypothetical protein